MLDEIYSETNKLLACVQSAASKEGLSVSEVLEMELNISKTEKRTVRTSIVDSLSKISFQGDKSSNLETLSTLRQLSLTKQLAGLFHSQASGVEQGNEEEFQMSSESNAKSSACSPLVAIEVGEKRNLPSDEESLTENKRRSKRPRMTVQYRNMEEAYRSYPPKKKSGARKLGKEKCHREKCATNSNIRAILSCMTPEAIKELFNELDLGVEVAVKEAVEEACENGREILIDDDETFESIEKIVVAKPSSSSEIVIERDGGKFVPSTSQFQDDVPKVLPPGLKWPTPYSGPQFPDWCFYATEIPSKWPKAAKQQIPIEHCAPFLNALHLPPNHRSNIFIRDVELLKRNHHMVYWRAAYNAHRKNGMPPSFLTSQQTRPSVTDENILYWEAAIKRDDAAKEYFGECREQLGWRGYCVLEGMLADDKVPGTIASFAVPKIGLDGKFWILLQKYISSTFSSGKDSLRTKLWYPIVNRGFDEDQKAAQIGVDRFTTSWYAVMSGLETEKTKELGRSKAIVDVRVRQVMAALQVQTKKHQSLTGHSMYAPCTGGRWLLTSEGCERQKLHTNFPTLTASEMRMGKNPGYFAICTGAHEVPIWVCPHSHMLIANASDEDVEALSRATYASLVKIPTFSIFVGRGDIFHAGAAFNDSPSRANLIRYHMYFVPAGHELPDGVHLISEFTPRFDER